MIGYEVDWKSSSATWNPLNGCRVSNDETWNAFVVVEKLHQFQRPASRSKRPVPGRIDVYWTNYSRPADFTCPNRNAYQYKEFDQLTSSPIEFPWSKALRQFVVETFFEARIWLMPLWACKSWLDTKLIGNPVLQPETHWMDAESQMTKRGMPL